MPFTRLPNPRPAIDQYVEILFFLPDILYGRRSQLAAGNLYMAHRCGFTQKVLIGTLQAAGFAGVASMRRGHPYYDLYAVATKIPMPEADLRALAAAHFPG